MRTRAIVIVKDTFMGCHRFSFFFALACSILFSPYYACGQIQAPASQSSAPHDSSIEADHSSPEPIEGASAVVRAEQLFRSGQFAEAIAEYQGSIKKGSDVGAAYAGLARVYLTTKKVKDAYDAAQKAVELAPSLSDAHVVLGEVYFRMGKLTDAGNEFLIPFNLKAPTARAYYGLFRTRAAAFNESTALAALNRAYALDPADPDIASAWMRYRPLDEQITSLKQYLASGDTFYDRTERAKMKDSLAVMEDREAHPERTCSLANRVKSTTLMLKPPSRLHPDYPGAGLDIYVNGYWARLMLGNRSRDGIILSNTVAQKSHVQKISRTDIEGEGVQDPPEAYTGLVKSIKIGKLQFNNCYVTVAEEVSSDSSFKVFEGTVGIGMFSHFIVDVDIPDGRIKLNGLPPIPPSLAKEPIQDSDVPASYHDRYVPPEMSGWAQGLRIGDLLLVESKMNGSGPKLLDISLAPGRNFFSVAAVKETSTLGEKASHSAFDGSGFIGETFLTGSIKLELGGQPFKQTDGIAFDFTPPSNALGVELSGDLGFEFLKNFEFKIDYRDGLVDFGGNEKPQRFGENRRSFRDH